MNDVLENIAVYDNYQANPGKSFQGKTSLIQQE